MPFGFGTGKAEDENCSRESSSYSTTMHNDISREKADDKSLVDPWRDERSVKATRRAIDSNCSTEMVAKLMKGETLLKCVSVFRGSYERQQPKLFVYLINNRMQTLAPFKS